MGKLNTCEFYRRFGVEIELNTTTNIIKDKKHVPDGSEVVAEIIRKVCNDYIALNGWLHVNNNDSWIIKPDSTCGIEINSPILKGGFDLAKLCKVVENLAKHPEIRADERCSFHVHVNLEDLDEQQIGAVLAWWIKCEAVFFDSVPLQRKCHRHAQLIGMCDRFESHIANYPADYIIDALSDVKYHSANVYHMRQKRRKSAEFRIAGNEFCLNPIFVKNWIRLLLHFVECGLERGMPPRVRQGDPWTGLFWLSPKEVFQFLKFNDNNLISPGLKQTKHWFLKQLRRNVTQSGIGFWQSALREPAIKEISEMVVAEEPVTDQDQDTLLYSKEFFL